MAQESAAIRETAAENLRNKVATALWLAEGGMSLRQASQALGMGLHSLFTNALGAEARARGLTLFTGRHRDFSKREARVRELAAQGLTIAKIVEKMRPDDDPHINGRWIYDNCPDLVGKRGTSVPRKPRKITNRWRTISALAMLTGGGKPTTVAELQAAAAVPTTTIYTLTWELKRDGMLTRDGSDLHITQAGIDWLADRP